MHPLYDTLCGLLASKAQDLFTDYTVPWHSVDATPEGDSELCGILGFTGDHLCGSVVIAATQDAVASSNPIGDGASRAWVAELANQLVGRFKNALLRHGVEVALSIPVVLTATHLTPLPQTQITATRLAVGTGFMTIWLEIEAAPDLQLAEPTADSAIAGEGEAMMF
jgi:CheY-specific phosphatase CheX